jgi:hypothetical protein
VEVSALTKPEDAFARRDPKAMTPEEKERWSCSPYVRSIAYQIQEAIPGAEAKPVLQVANTEGRIVDRVGFLMWILVAAGLTTAALAVTSMMLATVLERRVEIAHFQSPGRDTRVWPMSSCSKPSLSGSWEAQRATFGKLDGPEAFGVGLMARRVSRSYPRLDHVAVSELVPERYDLAVGAGAEAVTRCGSTRLTPENV